MYTIGEISKIVNISANALRYYDEIGLLKPMLIQNNNQYRYYSDIQIKDILFIMELKQYGFTLDEIKNLMQNKTNQKFKQMLDEKLVKLHNEIARLNDSSILLEKRICEIIKEDDVKMKGRKILIVDDLELVRIMIKNIVEEYGYISVGQVSNGEEAVAAYEKLKPDLVIMDITMPIMDGIDATKKITEKHKDARILMCSGMSHTQVILESIKAGARCFISKPLSSLSLMNAVEKAFDDNYIYDINDLNCNCTNKSESSISKSYPLEEKAMLLLKDKITGVSKKLSSYFFDESKQNCLLSLLTVESITIKEFKTLLDNSNSTGSIEYKTPYLPLYIHVYGEFKNEQEVLKNLLHFTENNLNLALPNHITGDIILGSDDFTTLAEDYSTILISLSIEFSKEDKGFVAISIPHCFLQYLLA